LSVLVESVACTVDDAVRAEAAGAGRIELVAAISEGGLTPSLGCLSEVKDRCRIPVVTMLRPRGGGFEYTEAEFSTMMRDATLLCESGADGLVVGMLTEDGEVDTTRLRRLVDGHRGITWVFHRAFDSVRDPLQALDELVRLGFARVLTSGQASTAFTGAERLRELREYAIGRIEIMPGGGLRAANAAEILRLSGAESLHLGPFVPYLDRITGASHLVLDGSEVEAVVSVARLQEP
jgi:copper homeostasis protein